MASGDSQAGQARPPRQGPAGDTFEAYGRLPATGRIARQLRIMRELDHEFERHLGEALSCNPTDLAAMQHLIISGPMSPGELAHRLGVTTAAGSMIVDRLVALGHVERRPHDADRRRVVVLPAKESVDRAIAELLPVIEGVAEVTDSLSTAERATVERFLDGVIGVYSDAVGRPPSD